MLTLADYAIPRNKPLTKIPDGNHITSKTQNVAKQPQHTAIKAN